MEQVDHIESSNKTKESTMLVFKLIPVSHVPNQVDYALGHS